MKKTISAIFAVIIMTTMITACGGGEKKSDTKDQTPADKLAGEWTIVEATGDWADLNIGTIYTFGDEGAFSTKAGIIESKGKVSKLDDKSVTVKFDNLETEFVYNYKFDGEKLIIEVAGSNQVFTLEKK
jgi:uncharacterized alpha/beta hydrolase family protein